MASVEVEVGMNCKACGAGADANHLTCQFCGAATVELNAKQELEAIRELASTAKRIGAEQEDFMKSLMAQTGAAEGTSKHERIAQLWSNAFVPMTFEAQFQALTQVTGAITTSGRSDHAGKHLANEALIGRGEILAATMNATAAQDPGLVARATAITTQFQSTKNKAEKFEQAGRNKAKLMVIFGIGFFVLIMSAAGLIIAFGDTQHLDSKCRGDNSSCDRDCQYAACAELCFDDITWACEMKERVDTPRGKK